ncbi:MAG: hypothetical protein HY272_11105 [Gammaproteobacteria bacterium]|nr:hypothetical protein [Gammaproteobacteria bacterium]
MSFPSYRILSLGCCSLGLLLSFTTQAAIPLEPGVVGYGKDTSITLHLNPGQTLREVTLSPGGPQSLQRIPLPSAAQSITQSGQFLLIGTEDGLHVLDTASNTLISQIAHAGGFKQILARDTAALALDSNNTLLLIDLSTPAQPRIGEEIKADRIITSLGISNGVFFATLKDSKIARVVVGNRDSLTLEILPVPSATIHAITGDGDNLYFADDQGFLVGTIENNALRILGRYYCNSPATSVAINNGLALINCNGITVVDVSDPSLPLWLGSHQQLGNVIQIVSDGAQPLALTDNGLLFRLTIDNPAEPSITNSWRSAEPLRGAIDHGDKIYALTANAIELIDAAPAVPQLSNEALNFGQGVNLGGERRVFVSDHLAYVADWFSGIHIYDIQHPERPSLLSSMHTPGSPKGIIVRNNIAYVADDDHGLQVIDVRDPGKPKQITSLATSGLAYTPKLSGNHLYLASHRGGFQIIDISDPQTPRLITDYDTPGKAWSLEVRGHLLYVADDDSGLLIFDVEDSTHPRLIGQFTPGGAAEEVVVRDNIAFVAFFNDGLYILDVSDPAQPNVISHLALPGNARGLDIIGDRAYVADWLAGIQIVDISKLEQPQLIGTLDTPGASWGVKVNGDNALVMDWWGGFTVVDIRDPRQLRTLGSYHRRGQVHNSKVRGNYLFVADGTHGLQVFDIKNPLNPTWITGADFAGHAYDLALSHNEVLVAAGSEGIIRIEASDPFNVRVQESLRGLVDVRQLTSFNNIVFALDQGHALLALDRSQPGTLQILDRLEIAAQQFLLLGHQLLLATDNGLALIAFEQARGFGTVTMLSGNYVPEHLLSLDQGKMFISAVGQQLRLHSIEGTQLTTLSQLDVGARIRALSVDENTLYVATDTEFTFYRLENTQFEKTASYPLLMSPQSITLHNGTAYLGGGETPVAIRLLPALAATPSNDSTAAITVPGSLPVGNYHLQLRFDDNTSITLRNALRVDMPAFGKPKMSLDQFKQLLEQKKGTDLFVQPPNP